MSVPSSTKLSLVTVEELVNAVALYESRDGSPTLAGFLEETALNGRENESDDGERREHAVTLMTLHSAKGLEFPCVYLVGMEEGLLPHRRSVADGGRNIEEERRLCYVGVTRAQRELTMSFCKSRMKWGKPRPSLMSRFVMEMRGDTERARRIAEHAEEIFRLRDPAIADVPHPGERIPRGRPICTVFASRSTVGTCLRALASRAAAIYRALEPAARGAA
jgi:DNA helicase-2/ATP-dependent DNA helicase PcrA